MDRSPWLRERRKAVEAQYDNEAPDYDGEGGVYPVAIHASFVDRLLATCPAGGRILDAPCGTGKWFAQVAASGRRVVGVDQSAGMLAQARAKDSLGRDPEARWVSTSGSRHAHRDEGSRPVREARA